MSKKKQPEALIMRASHNRENPYVLIDRTMANDERLSFEARGLLTYLLAQKDDFQIWVSALINRSPNAGRDRIYRILKELELCGYIERVRIRNEHGHIVRSVYYISELPAHFNPIDRTLLGEKPREKKEPPCLPHPRRDNPEQAPDSLHPGYPDRDNPDRDNPTQISNNLEAINNHHQLSAVATKTDDEPIDDGRHDATASGGGVNLIDDEGDDDQRAQSHPDSPPPPTEHKTSAGPNKQQQPECGQPIGLQGDTGPTYPSEAEALLISYGVVSEVARKKLAVLGATVIRQVRLSLPPDKGPGALVRTLEARLAPPVEITPSLIPQRPPYPPLTREYHEASEVEQRAMMADYQRKKNAFDQARYGVVGGAA